jgi:thiosulfate/3-mercaptopyruvate sulfurtransferase
MKPLITVAQLKALPPENLVVFDCRFDLLDKDAGRRAYAAGHIPGAFYLDLEQDLSGPRTAASGRHPLPDTDEVAKKLGASGVRADCTVVVYDGGEGMAPRAWWLLRYLGHDDVRVLDGGVRAWTDAGLPLTQERPTARPVRFVPRPRPEMIASLEEVEQVVAGRRAATLLDARDARRYRGELEPIDPIAGHIPGAKNAPWQEGLDESGRWLPADEQRRRFRDLAVDQEVIVYCGSGVTACADLLALELAGIRGAKLYPGSWSQWCALPDHPVARDPAVSADGGTDADGGAE